jgi:hypothetical protein
MTPGIKISCINKKKLFLIQRNSNDLNLTKYYKKYCRILTSVIKLAKKRYYNNLLTCSNNKNKTAWNIIKNNSNIKPNVHNITSVKVKDKLPFNGQTITETFNKHFVSVAQHIRTSTFSI